MAGSAPFGLRRTRLSVPHIGYILYIINIFNTKFLTIIHFLTMTLLLDLFS